MFPGAGGTGCINASGEIVEETHCSWKKSKPVMMCRNDLMWVFQKVVADSALFQGLHAMIFSGS